MTLDKRLTWSKHIDQVRKKAAQRLGILGPHLNRRSGLSFRNGVLLYKQLIRPMMYYACPVWRCAARFYIKKLQVLQSKCLRIVTNAPWYIGNRQIHDDLGVPYFPDHIRSLTERFDSKLAGVGNPLVQQLGRHLRWPGADLLPPNKGEAGSLPYPDWGFLWFSSVVRQMPGYNLNSGHGLHSS